MANSNNTNTRNTSTRNTNTRNTSPRMFRDWYTSDELPTKRSPYGLMALVERGEEITLEIVKYGVYEFLDDDAYGGTYQGQGFYKEFIFQGSKYIEPLGHRVLFWAYPGNVPFVMRAYIEESELEGSGSESDQEAPG